MQLRRPIPNLGLSPPTKRQKTRNIRLGGDKRMKSTSTSFALREKELGSLTAGSIAQEYTGFLVAAQPVGDQD